MPITTRPASSRSSAGTALWSTRARTQSNTCSSPHPKGGRLATDGACGRRRYLSRRRLMNAAIEELMVVPVINPAASTSAATAITGATVDRAGFKGVTFAVQIGAAGSGITAGTVTLNESAAANMSGSVASTQ